MRTITHVIQPPDVEAYKVGDLVCTRHNPHIIGVVGNIEGNGEQLGVLRLDGYAHSRISSHWMKCGEGTVVTLEVTT